MAPISSRLSSPRPASVPSTATQVRNPRLPPQARPAESRDLFQSAQVPSKWFPETVETAPRGSDSLGYEVTSSTVTVEAAGPTPSVTHGTATSQIQVDQALTLEQVTATVDLHHRWVRGLTVTVTSPSGKTATLPLAKGHDEQGTFDLSQAFAGETTKGAWTLTVNDSLKTDQGTVNGWSLQLTGAPAQTNPIPPDTGAGPIDPRNIPPADWTCFVNLNADNSLESFGKTDLNEMEKVGSLAGKMNVIALVDGGNQQGGGWEKGTRLMYVTKDPNNSSNVVSREIAVDPESALGKLLAAGNGELNTGSPEVVHAAIDYVQRNVPSEHFMVDLWDHGNDWRGVSYDDHPDASLDMPELQAALSGLSQKVDIVSADACLMATVEVADTVQAAGADWLVASEEVEPGPGWDYTDFLGRVGKLFEGSEDVSAAQIADAISDSYAAGGLDNSTMSVTDLSGLSALNQSLDAFSDALLAAGGLQDKAVKAAYGQAKRYDDRDQMDLGDFATRVSAGTSNAAVKAAADALLTQLHAVSTPQSGNAYGWKTSTGLTIYAPQGSVDRDYQVSGAAWLGSRWNQVIETYSQRLAAA
jgi:subtilisin-like proprotein convertase family protein